jgi:DNA-binding HxlR family transcriptional regulator
LTPDKQERGRAAVLRVLGNSDAMEVLAYLLEGLTAAQLVHRYRKVKRSTLSERVGLLVNAGAVLRQRMDDGRSVRYVVTSRGRAVLDVSDSLEALPRA